MSGRAQVAFHFTSTFGGDLVKFNDRGIVEIQGDDSGVYLLKRTMGLFDDPILIVDSCSKDVRGDSFRCRTLKQLDVNDTMIVNFDMPSTPRLLNTLRAGSWRNQPRAVNFCWWNTSEYRGDTVGLGLIGLAMAVAPTFANSWRTRRELLELAQSWLAPSRRRDASSMMGAQPLGIDLERTPHARDRRLDYDGPLRVWYPSTWLFARKRPDLFTEIVDSLVASVGPDAVTVRVRLKESQLVRDQASGWYKRPYDTQISGDRDQYARELLETDVFVATADDESYGLAYLEALRAGAVGIFPRKPWAENILPAEYPFLYSSVGSARQMLMTVGRDLAKAREAIDYMPSWIAEGHDANDFDVEFRQFVTEHMTG